MTLRLCSNSPDHILKELEESQVVKEAGCHTVMSSTTTLTIRGARLVRHGNGREGSQGDVAKIYCLDRERGAGFGDDPHGTFGMGIPLRGCVERNYARVVIAPKRPPIRSKVVMCCISQ